MDPFSLSELQAILEGAQHLYGDFGTLLQLWAQTGMRKGEVCGLQCHDVDLERGTALVRRTWSRGRVGPTKTGLSRVVALTHPVAEATQEWRPGTTPGAQALLTRLRQLKVRSLDPTAFVFPRGNGQPIPSWNLHHRWRRVLARAKVRYRSPEQLRHTFASTMLSRNAPLLYVQKQGGWRSAAVLLRVYARWLPEEPLPAPQAHPVRISVSPNSGI